MSVLDPVLTPVYYLVSAVMRGWHTVFATVLDPSTAWVLAVVFLVVTLRAALLVPAIAQLRTAVTLRRIAPELAALRTRHTDDPVRLLRETSALQRAHGASTWRTFLPALVQLPVFLGLLHVLQGFHDGTHQLRLRDGRGRVVPRRQGRRRAALRVRGDARDGA